jgi:hypothetical protein
MFGDLKQRLCLALVLSLLDLQQPFDIKKDASNYVVGTILTQHVQPVAYNSKTLSDVIRKYPTYNKEMYSIVILLPVETLHSLEGDSHPH